ncbi:unnamed protein product [Alopecurus aequalis]
MIWAKEADFVLGGEKPEGWDNPAVMDSAEASVTDGDVAQGSFGAAAEDFDAMMVESGGGLQGEAEGDTVQVQTVAAETVGVSDCAMPQHAEVELSEDDQRAIFHLPPLDSTDGFRVSDLVWAKLEGHPWWPGEIFDPSDASELALKHQREGSHLVAFFGDNTFAWCDESQLKPFMANCSQMEKQENSDAFTISVNHALQELSRRILSATSCSCLPEELSENAMSYVVENSGLKTGVTCSKVNQAEMLKSFSPESLLRYVRSLALSPGRGGDLQDLVIACSQLMSFYRSKGFPEIASFQSASGWAENDIDTLSTKNFMPGETVTNEPQPSHVKPKRGRGRPRKRKPDDNLELMEKGPILKPCNGPSVQNNTGETECGEFDIVVKKSAKRKRVQRQHGVKPKDYAVSASTEVSMVENVEGGEQKILPCPKVETTDHMQDAYWSGLSLHNIPIHSRKGASGKTRPIRKRRPTWRARAASSDVSSPVQDMQLGTLSHDRKIEVIKRSIIHVDEKMVHEVKPTALVMSFGRSTDLPSEMDLIKMFSLYGPLKETETEVHKNTNTVKVVFKKRVDAERAFSVAGNFVSFGPALRSFRLVNMPFSLSTTELNYPKLCPEDTGSKIPAPSLDAVQVDTAGMVKQAGQDEGTTKPSLHAEGRNKESPDVLSDTMQTEIVDETPKHDLACVDGVVEASTDTMEVDDADEAREGTSISRDLRAQDFTGYVAKQSGGRICVPGN